MKKETISVKLKNLYSFFYLVNHNNKTIIAATCKTVLPGVTVMAFIPQLNDHIKIKAVDIVCSIKKPAIKPAGILSAFSNQR